MKRGTLNKIGDASVYATLLGLLALSFGYLHVSLIVIGAILGVSGVTGIAFVAYKANVKRRGK